MGLCPLYPVPELGPVISLSHKDMVILKAGEPFKLTCNSTNVNPDFSLKWEYPSAAVRGVLFDEFLRLQGFL